MMAGKSALAARVTAVFMCLGLLPTAAGADDLRAVLLVDLDGKAIADAVVYIDSDTAAPVPPGAVTIVDQIDKQFSPRVAAIQAGSSVDFRNSDSVSHHVYSFANPNNFELPLYKGETQPTVSFDHPGLVTLGCNIHDSMLGYILVVETPHFAVTDERGVAMLTGLSEIEAGNPLRVWSPDLSGGEILAADLVNSRLNGASVPGSATNAGDKPLSFRVNTRAAVVALPASDTLSWDEY